MSTPPKPPITQKVYTVRLGDGSLRGRLSGGYVSGPTPKPYASRAPATAAADPKKGEEVIEHVLWHDLDAAAEAAYDEVMEMSEVRDDTPFAELPEHIRAHYKYIATRLLRKGP